MKILVSLLALLLLIPAAVGQQTSNAMTFTAITASLPVITSLGGVSPTGKIYTGAKLQILGTGFTSSCNVNIDTSVQPGSSVTFVSATEIDYIVQPGLGSTAGTVHNVSVSCNSPVLTMNSPTVPCTAGKGCVTGITYNGAVSLLISANQFGPAPGTFSGWNIYRSGTSGGPSSDPYVKVNAAPFTGLSYTDTSAVAGNTYYYVVTAVDPTGLELGFADIEMVMTLPVVQAFRITVAKFPLDKKS
jgi:hypothetical protein